MVLDIWEQGYGVTTLHLFHSIIPVEAYTREACMIEAMSKYTVYATVKRVTFTSQCQL